MSYFDQLIQTHSDGKMPDFLWCLKLSSEEYAGLKNEIRSRQYRDFIPVRREVVLYMSEWWRRDFVEGHASYEDISLSLFDSPDYAQQLSAAAISGARSRGIQIITTTSVQGERENLKYSILYQGGLPMNYIKTDVTSHQHSAWNTFFKGLVWDEQDFREIPGIIAPMSSSIISFCSMLKDAADASDPSLLPFSYNQSWWNIIIENYEEEEVKRRARNPFQFNWLLNFDDINKTIGLSFHVFCPQHLSDDFIEQHNLTDKTFCSISVLNNDSIILTAEFNEKHYCRRRIDNVFSCCEGDDISVIINETGEILSTRYLDFSDPKLITIKDSFRNVFSLCDNTKLAVQDCKVVADDFWTSEEITPEIYKIGEKDVSVFSLAKRDNVFILNSDPQCPSKEFDPSKHLSWTEIDDSYALKLNVLTKEIIYSAPDRVQFFDGKADRNHRASQPVLYAAKGSHNWEDLPKIGVIRAKLRGTESVEAVKFINVGSLSTELISTSQNSCKIRIVWPLGDITSSEAEYDGDNIWTVRKENLSDVRYASFDFNPQRYGSKFTLHFCIPFYDFRIIDYKGNSIQNDAIIPIDELDNYRYYLYLNRNLYLYPNSRNSDLRYIYSNNSPKDNKITEYLCDNPLRRDIKLPVDGRLAALFVDGSEQIIDVFEKSSDSLPNATATSIIKYDGQNFVLNFKYFPYFLNHDDSRIWVSNSRHLSEYSEDLLAFPIDHPEKEPIHIFNADGYYMIPEAILQSEYRKWFVYGSLRGYVLPMLLVLDETLNDQSRYQYRNNTLSQIKNDLCSAPAFSPLWNNVFEWFEKLPLGLIPGSSVLQLVALADDNLLLEKFAIQLYANNCTSTESLENLSAVMIDFQNQMSFLWSWASNDHLNQFISDALVSSPSVLRAYYNKWVFDKKADYLAEYLINGNHISECVDDFCQDFSKWFTSLKSISLPSKKLLYPDVNSNGDGLVSDEARNLFAEIDQYIERSNLAPDERWILERRKLSDMFSVTNFGDFGSSESVKREIRKSVIYGLKFRMSDEI